MPTTVLLDTFDTVKTGVLYLTLVVGALATLFSVIYLGGRAFSPKTVRTRLRLGVLAAIILIVLAALDIYLTLTHLPVS